MLFRHNVFLEMSARLISENFDIYGMERPNNSQVMQKVIKSGRLKAMKGLASNKKCKRNCRVAQKRQNSFVWA